MAQFLKIKENMSSIWPKACTLMIVGVLYDLTWLPLLGGGSKSWYIILLLGFLICVDYYDISYNCGHS